MQEIAFRALLTIAPLVLVACGDRSPVSVEYARVAKLPSAEMSRQICSMSPSARVDLYLYAVEKRRPSDYAVIPKDCMDSEVVNEMASRLRKSKNGVSTFALVYALHSATPTDKKILQKKLDVTSQCSRFFEPGSPCHRLAKDIDSP